VNRQPNQHGRKVPSEFGKGLADVLHSEDLAGDEKEDADRRKVNDPGSDAHHDHGHAAAGDDIRQIIALTKSRESCLVYVTFIYLVIFFL
jgi:hypothetical protein